MIKRMKSENNREEITRVGECSRYRSNEKQSDHKSDHEEGIRRSD